MSLDFEIYISKSVLRWLWNGFLKWHPVFVPDVQQKLVFLGQDGYDIFGKNDMFAPRVKWQSLEKSVEEIKTAAESYENAFNGIMSTIEKEQNFKKVIKWFDIPSISESHSLVLEPP